MAKILEKKKILQKNSPNLLITFLYTATSKYNIQ